MQPTIEPSKKAVIGNKEVVAFLEKWVERAKFGDMDFVAVTACEGPINSAGSFCGVRESYFAGHFGCLDLADRLSRALKDGPMFEMHESQDHVPSNLVAYDVTNGPTNFDFISWLITAEMQRIKEGGPKPLKVCFVAFPERKTKVAQEKGHLEGICVPAVRMVGGEITEEAVNGRIYKHYCMNHLVEAHKRGEVIPKLDPIAWQGWDNIDYFPDVTITLREAEHWPHRNSNFEEWLKFANWLKEQGKKVVFIRDTAKADEPIEGFATCPSASKELNVRLSLYERSSCNLFVSNGCFMLALFGSKPWLMFNEVNQMDPFVPNTPSWWREFHGVSVGEQFPWCKPNQRIVWKRDTFENMKEAWLNYIEKQV